MSTSTPRVLVDRFRKMKALVVGDLMLDHFVWGSVSRISPEAPVPVVEVSRETEMPGGAGNVAVNMAVLGAEIYVVGLLGEDEAGDRLFSQFQRYPIRTEAAVRSADRPTIVKTRIIAQHQQVVRVDRERKGPLSTELQKQLRASVDLVLPKVDAVVLSDYAKGVLSEDLIEHLISSARRRDIPVMVDPKPDHFARYKRVTCITPNLQEALEGAGMRSAGTDHDIEMLGLQLLNKLKSQSILITRGEKGMSLFETGKPVYHIPTRAREVFDVTGAGDTVISTLTLALAAGAKLRQAAELANFAAGLVVGKIGTASVTGAELLKAVGAHHG